MHRTQGRSNREWNGEDVTPNFWHLRKFMQNWVITSSKSGKFEKLKATVKNAYLQEVITVFARKPFSK